MWQVKNVRYIDCVFTNNINSSPINGRGDGIYSIDAGYSVSKSTFDSFKYGIRSVTKRKMQTFSVVKSTFRDNSAGVYAGAVSEIQIKENTFLIGTQPFFDRLNHGIIVEGGTGYHIEDNDFTGTGQSFNRTGVLIRNTGDESNKVFRNDFTGLDYGNLSNGDNRNNDNPFLGLEYICNTNANNTLFDFAVPAEYDGQGNPVFTTGISENQGSPQKSAANSFSNMSGTTGSNFNNQSPWTVRYWYNPTSPMYVYNVLPEQGIFNNCGDDDRTDKPKEDFDRVKGEYDISRETYDTSLDGGSTTGLIAEINQGGNHSSGPLFQRLKD